MFEENLFENVLKSFRVRRGKEWTQKATAKLLGVGRRTYVGWENGESLPSPEDLKNIVANFELSEADEAALYRAAAQVPPEIHTIPFPKNPFFTGRAVQLEQLSQQLQEHGSVAINQPVSISGLGGIGKTQLALEYAHRSYRTAYRAVLWVKAADVPTLQAEYDKLAQRLGLPEHNDREPERRVQAVKRWLDEHTKWLLVLDNADDLYVARSFLPTKPRGHILVTTRSRIVSALSTNTMHIEMDKMEPAEGLLFLLRRVGLVQGEADITTLDADVREAATKLLTLLDGHPLALDQAGAYIEETSVSVTKYIQSYHEARQDLLQRRGFAANKESDHPDSVAATVVLTFEGACKHCSQAADVLYFCSFLQADAIPEELLQQADDLKLDALSLNEAIAALQCYSLVKLNTQDKTFSMHRLVQAVVVDSMPDDLRQQWRERVVRALNAAFPEVEFKEWAKCGRLLPHVLVCERWTEDEIAPTLEVAELFNKSGLYLREQGQYVEAEALLIRVLTIRKQQLGSEHPDVASTMSNLSITYRQQGKYEQAELLCQRALAIREHYFGKDHLETARSLNNLALLYWNQGKYDQAEPLYQRALVIYERQMGAEHPYTARSLNNLALLYREQGKYGQAETLYQRALSIYEKQMGDEHPDTARVLNNLAELYREQGKYDKAEVLYKQALSIKEQYLGVGHSSIVISLINLAELYRQQGKYKQAEPLYQRALSIQEQHLRGNHPDTAIALHGLARVYQQRGNSEQPEILYRRALTIQKHQLGLTHPDTQETGKDYVEFLRSIGRDAEAVAIESSQK